MDVGKIFFVKSLFYYHPVCLKFSPCHRLNLIFDSNIFDHSVIITYNGRIERLRFLITINNFNTNTLHAVEPQPLNIAIIDDDRMVENNSLLSNIKLSL